MLAGFAGALAFIWIVVTVLLQAAELREQREQFEKMADAQEAQVALLVKQGDIFLTEQRDRSEARSKRLLERSLEVIRKNIFDLAEHNYAVAWMFDIIPFYRNESGYRSGGLTNNAKLYEAFAHGAVVDDAFRILAERTKVKCDEVKRFIGPRMPAKNFSAEAQNVLSSFDVIIAMTEELSPEDQLYLQLIEIEKIADNVRERLRCYGVDI